MKESIKKKVKEILMEQQVDRIAAGVLVKCIETDRILLLLRNDNADEPNTWALVGGGIDDGENVLEGLKREVKEEMSIDPDIIEYEFINKNYIKEKNMDFHYYVGVVSDEFIPTLDEENLDYRWCDKNDLPSPLYPGLINNINKI